MEMDKGWRDIYSDPGAIAFIVFQNLVVCSSEIERGPVPCPAYDHFAI